MSETVNLKWHFPQAPTSGPAICGPRVVVGSVLDNCVYCLDLHSGRVLWQHVADGPVSASPTFLGNRVFIGGSEGHFYCLDLETGHPVWTTEVSVRRSRSSPWASCRLEGAAVAGGRVAVLDVCGDLVCMEADSGRECWRFTVPDDGLDGGPVISHDYVLANNDLHQYCLRLTDGSLVWRSQVHTSSGPPAATATRVYVSSADQILCLDLNDGRTEWAYEDEIVIQSPLTLADGKLYFCVGADTIRCLDTTSREIRWSWKIGDGSDQNAPPAVTEDRVYLNARDDVVYCLDPATGIPIWSWSHVGELDGTYAIMGNMASAVVAGPYVVASGDYGTLCLEQRHIERIGWPRPRGDDCRRGLGRSERQAADATWDAGAGLEAYDGGRSVPVPVEATNLRRSATPDESDEVFHRTIEAVKVCCRRALSRIDTVLPDANAAQTGSLAWIRQSIDMIADSIDFIAYHEGCGDGESCAMGNPPEPEE
jgi:outer membrane protein assembly factor BamB